MFSSKNYTRYFLILLTLLLAGCVQNQTANLAAVTGANIDFLNAQPNLVYSSGQPSQEQLAVLANAGVRHIISLRTEGELEWDESAVVSSLGMEFHSLPVSGRDGITSANAQTMEQILASLEGQPVLIHCGTSNRVGALKALTARESGASIDDAIALGRRWGLTGMEQAVRTQLSGN